MQLARTTIRLCAVLLSLTYMGCGSDNEGGGGNNTTGGATTTVTGTKATGGRTGTGGASATTKATTGGASSTVVTTGGATAVTTGGTSAVTSATGGASSTVVATTGGATAVTTGGATAVTTGGSTSATSFSISGTVTGLSGSGLVLAIGSDTLAVAANGAFTFPKSYASGSAIAVAIATQPSGPAQVCTVTGGTIASLTSNVSNVAVACATNSYKVGGTVTGLTGTGLVLQDNAGDDLAVAADGAFVFVTKVASGQAYTVTIKTQPSTPTQKCTVSGGSGTVGTSDVSTVTVNCSTESFTIGGTVSGLDGTGLVLQNNAGDDVAVSANGSFSFATPVLSGQPFAVTVKTQPSEKSQTCVVTSGTGTVAGGNVTTVAVDCTTNKYAISGTITGLVGSGLTLQNNLGDNLSIASGTTFAFTTEVASGSPYSVTVLTNPNTPAQICTVADGSGTVTNAAISNVAITCVTQSFTVGGNVVGMTQTGLVLQNNAGDDLVIDADGAFVFVTPVLSGANFAVTIKTQPGTEYCSVSGGTGTMGGANVSSVTINCSTEAYTVGGTVTGLAGQGLELSLNGGAPLTVSGNGTFAFSTLIAKNGAYDVTIAQQPSSPSQTCILTNKSGTVTTAAITDVTVNCFINSYPIGGTVTGLAGTGLVLQNNAGNDLAVAANGAFAFPINIASGLPYAVTVKTQPTSPMQDCTVSNGGGTVTGAAITNVQVTCVTKRYAVGGTISGLVGSVVLSNNTTDTLTLTANGTFTFDQTVASGTNYNVEVTTQPSGPTQTCTVTGGTGPIVDAAVNTVVITCVTNKYTINAAVTGLASGESLELTSGADVLALTADGTFAFATQITSGEPYSVAMTGAPLTQNCSLSGNSGTVGGSDVTVTVNCTNKPTVGGTVTGLAGTGLVLTLNGSEDLPVSGTSFAFPTFFEDGDPYEVTVKTQPQQPSQTCTVTNGTGTIAGAGVTDVEINCTTNLHTLSVNVTGLAAPTGVVLQNNLADNLTVTANGVAAFATKVASGSNYDVSVLTQPSVPSQTCVVTANTGTVADADITLAVNCTTNKYKVGGTVTGGAVSGLVLRNNAGDDLNIAATGTFAFATSIDSGAAYAVTVATQPTGATCAVTNGSGTVGSADVTTVAVACSTQFNFDTSTEGANYYLPPTGSTITFSSTEGSPSPGAVVALLNYATGTTATCPSSTNIQLLGSLNLTGYTTMTAWVKVIDEWPSGDRSGGVQLFINGSSGFKTGAFTSWWSMTIGQWKQLVWTITAGTDLTAITSWGVGVYEGAPAVCQPMTIEIDSITFQ